MSKSASSATWRTSMTISSPYSSFGSNGTRRAHSTASSRLATWIIQNPASSSLDSVNGPSETCAPAASWVTRAPVALGSRPSATSSAPASDRARL